MEIVLLTVLITLLSLVLIVALIILWRAEAAIRSMQDNLANLGSVFNQSMQMLEDTRLILEARKDKLGLNIADE